jgi:hypothetical protein
MRACGNGRAHDIARPGARELVRNPGRGSRIEVAWNGEIMDVEELRDFAARCLRVAEVCVDNELAERLRTTAREYLRLADEREQVPAQQQQQIPPRKQQQD